ncbi:MAG: endonuclease/exonuclease/phosphatase family metal-dependent hydrolase [Polaribacter sp.]|jgi:endonuclease/exonuclease/phosphatase family metal-dependent hydrolase
MKNIILLTLIFLQVACTPKPGNISSKQIRIASYNVALFRKAEDGLARDLASGNDQQIKNVAAVIQKTNPDVIALLEFDYDPSGKMLDAFQQNYLAKGQSNQKPISYPYRLQIPSNTGVLSSTDYNKDGKIELPNDAYGFGKYEGQYAFAILSKYPIDEEALRTYQQFLWKDMPDAKVPLNEDGSPYYSKETWEEFRLSSKNHISIPVKINNDLTIHHLVAHPTPPVFDGPEDRNGKRNFDEIRLLKDYIENADYLKDDKGQKGGLSKGEHFVILGDLNADPLDGDSYNGAINQLLNSPAINQEISNGKMIPFSQGGEIYNKKATDKGDPGNDTAFFGARIDYVLPSKSLKINGSGVFWPAEGEELHEIVKDKGASDHLLVWVDLLIEN